MFDGAGDGGFPRFPRVLSGQEVETDCGLGMDETGKGTISTHEIPNDWQPF